MTKEFREEFYGKGGSPDLVVLEFYYERTLFAGDKFAGWVQKMFGEDKIFGGSTGRRFAELVVWRKDYERADKQILKNKNLTAVKDYV